MAKITIKIRRIDPEVFTHKGLFDEGCYGSKCSDVCCAWGCDMDYGTYKLVKKYRRMIEPLIKDKVENCFSTKLTFDNDYVDGAYRETRVREEDDRCAFHLRDQKGCALFYLWLTKGLPKRIVPTICRTYPITWNRGELFVDKPLRKECKALEARPKGVEMAPTVWDTQKKDVFALFDFDPKYKKKIPELEEKAIKSFLRKKARKRAERARAKA
jgi:hypothetical protein